MADKIKICSLNCQGLGDANKRRDVLRYLRKSNYSILCLQDTHFIKSSPPLKVGTTIETKQFLTFEDF